MRFTDTASLISVVYPSLYSRDYRGSVASFAVGGGAVINVATHEHGGLPARRRSAGGRRRPGIRPRCRRRRSRRVPTRRSSGPSAGSGACTTSVTPRPARRSAAPGCARRAASSPRSSTRRPTPRSSRLPVHPDVRRRPRPSPSSAPPTAASRSAAAIRIWWPRPTRGTARSPTRCTPGPRRLPVSTLEARYPAVGKLLRLRVTSRDGNGAVGRTHQHGRARRRRTRRVMRRR